MIELKNPMHEVHYKGGEIPKPATVVSANDFPWMIRMVMLYIFGKNDKTCLVFWISAVIIIFLAIFVMLTNLASKSASIFTEVALEVICDAVFVIEFIVNLRFGHWMARTRYIEGLLTELSSVNSPEFTPHALIASWSRMLSIGVVVLTICWVTPLILGTVSFIALTDDNDADDDGTIIYPPDVVPAFVFWCITQIIIFMVSISMSTTWLWCVYLCYKRNEFYTKNIKTDDVVLEDGTAVNGFLSCIRFMEKMSEPWTTTTIIRVIAMAVETFHTGRTAVTNFYALRNYEFAQEGSLYPFDIRVTFCLTVFLALCAVFYLCVALSLAGWTGYVADTFIHDIKRKLRPISGQVDRTSRVLLLEVLGVVNDHSGEVGLYFGGVAMSLEKAVVIFTALGYVVIGVLAYTPDVFQNNDLNCRTEVPEGSTRVEIFLSQ